MLYLACPSPLHSFADEKRAYVQGRGTGRAGHSAYLARPPARPAVPAACACLSWVLARKTEDARSEHPCLSGYHFSPTLARPALHMLPAPLCLDNCCLQRFGLWWPLSVEFRLQPDSDHQSPSAYLLADVFLPAAELSPILRLYYTYCTNIAHIPIHLGPNLILANMESFRPFLGFCTPRTPAPA